MFLKQALSANRPGLRSRSLPAVFLAPAALLMLGGCATIGGKGEVGAPVASAPRAESAPAPVEPELTATEAAVAAQAGVAPAEAAQPAIDRSAVNPSAPTSYTVKRGDTLWDISSMFLRDPWLWPEIWQVNPQVENPHLIYPGDVLALTYGADGRPVISLARGGGARLDPRLRSTELDGAIATIPYSAIAAFLERPSLLTRDQIREAPRVLAFRDKHMIGGAGIEAYIRGLDGGTVNQRYNVVHVGEEIRDPDDGDLLGYQGVYTSTAVLLAPGEPAKAALTDSARETLEGDRLLGTESDAPLNFVPRAPDTAVRGQIVSVIDGVQLIGQYKIVAINRGAKHGLAPGHVLAIEEAGEIVGDRTRKNEGGVKASRAFTSKVQLPNERIGTMLVFRVFDRMSYALIVGASNPIRIADVVRKP
jgi:LysM repeat protein